MSILKPFLMGVLLLNAGFYVTAQQQKPAGKPAKTTTSVSPRNADAAASFKAMPELCSRYNIYAGVQHTYIGHFFLLPDGTYKVALSSDEVQYGSGLYRLNGNPVAIEWTEGLFRHNRWTGKISWSGSIPVRIVFSSLVYADREPGPPHSR